MSTRPRKVEKGPEPRASKSRSRVKVECLKLVRHLSDYVDQDLAQKLCEQINQHVERCSKCDQFLITLRQTVALCRQSSVKPLSSSLKAKLRREILQAVRARPKA